MRIFFGVSVSVAATALIVLLSGCGEQGEVALQNGIEALKKGDVSAAVLKLEKAVAKLPSDPDALYHLGIAYSKSGKADKSVDCFRKCASIARNDLAPLEYMAQVLAGAGKLQEARETPAKADQMVPGTPRILNAMGVVEIKSGDAKKAGRYLQEARDKDPSYAPVYFNLGVLYRDLVNNPAMAAGYFNQYLQLDPNGSHAAAARDSRQPRLDRKSSPADPMLAKAREALKSDDYGSAIESFKEAINKDPANPEAVWELALVYEKISNAAKAAECYRLFKKQFQNDPRAAIAAKKVGETEPLSGGISDPATVTKAKDAFGEGFRRHGGGDIDGAIAFYKRACQLDGSRADAFFNLGLAYKQKGCLESARAAFNSATELKPKVVQFRYMLALAYRDLKSNEKAIKELNKVLQLKPGYADAYYMLGVIYKDEKSPEKSKKYFDLYQEYQKPKP